MAFKRTRFSYFLLTITTSACLLPYINKPFNIDDPLFVWTGRQIQHNPIKCFSFVVNWDGFERPMHEITKNPPFASFYIAAVETILNGRELTLHIAFLPFAIGVALGTYRLASDMCSRPVLAVLIGTLSPAFVVSSTNVMCDTMMLSFWIWAIVLWREGIKGNNTSKLFLASLVISLAFLTKYFGICLLPLLAVYAVRQWQKWNVWAAYLSIPVVVILLYHFATACLYGKSLLFDATETAIEGQSSDASGLLWRLVVGVLFLGGSFPITLCCAHLLNWQKLFTSLVLGSLVTLTYCMLVQTHLTVANRPWDWWQVLQVGTFAVAGSLLAVSIGRPSTYDTRADRDLLCLWIIGTFIFAVFLNWTVNVRSILPILPAVGIMLVRAIETNLKSRAVISITFLSCAVCAILALFVARADYNIARSSQSAAIEINRMYRSIQGSHFFLGHWGFQYYMEQLGWLPIDKSKFRPNPNDVVVIPSNNHNASPEFLKSYSLIGRMVVRPNIALTTMSDLDKAGFYAHYTGPVPYIFGNLKPEEYLIFQVK